MNTKACTGCFKTLIESESFPFIPSKNRYHPRCFDCKRAYDREYWEKTKHKRNSNKKINAKKIRERNRKFILNFLKEHPCINCGEDDVTVLEFDHLENKTECLSNASGQCWSIQKLKKEIKKCQILCANCHRRKTAKQFSWYSGCS